MANEIIREKNREKVIETAKALIPRFGVEQTTIRKIAKEAGLSTRSVMNYYATKTDLLKDVLDRMLSDAYEKLALYLHTKEYRSMSGYDQIMSFERFCLEYAVENRDVVKHFTALELAIFTANDLTSENYYRGAEGNIFARVIKAAMEKGISDGSVDTEIPCDMESVITLSYTLTRYIRRLALTADNPVLNKRYDVEKMIESYMIVTKSVFRKKA